MSGGGESEVILARYGVRACALVENEGPFDMVLAAEGVGQAEALGRLVCAGDGRVGRPTTIVSSPFRRAVITANVVCEAVGGDVGVCVDEGVTEWLTPSLVGGPGSNVADVYVPFTAAEHRDGVWQAAEEGEHEVAYGPMGRVDAAYESAGSALFPEDEPALIRRAAATLDALESRGVIGPGKTVLIVSHAPVLLALAVVLAGCADEPKRAQLAPWPLGGVVSFVRGAEGAAWERRLDGYTAHLDGEAANGIQRWTLPCLE